MTSREWTFGPYQIKTLIGRGGMGEVYRAYDTVHERMVALKLLAAHLSTDDNYRARFRRECHLAARLREPHVIPIHSYGEHDGRLFLDMRLVEGRDLATILDEDGKLEPTRAVSIIGQVARALDAAHHDGLIHRDVKPSNVILDEGEDGDDDFLFAYLVDFGVARAVGDDAKSAALTSTGGAVGTFDYMPPERFTGALADRQSDVYSLACMLYEALTGERPFGAGQSLASLMYAHMNTAPPKASAQAGVNSLMDEVIARGMAKNPADRYPSATALASAARSALMGPGRRDRPTTAHGPFTDPTVTIEPAPPTHQRSPVPTPPSLTPPPTDPYRAGPMTPPPPNFSTQPDFSTQPANGPFTPPPPANRPFTPPPPNGPFTPPPPPNLAPYGPGPNGRKNRNRNLAVAGVAVAAVIAVVLVLALTRGNTGKTASSPPSTPQPTNTSTLPTSPQSSDANSLDPALVKLLPQTIPESDCKPMNPSLTHATKAITCVGSTDADNGPTTTTLYRYLDVATLRADLQAIFAANSLTKATANCPGIGYRDWNQTSNPDQVRGQMASYYDTTNDYSTITWDDEKTLLLATAQSPDRARLAGLCTWWTKP